MQLVDQDLLAEVQRVGLREQGQQPALVHAVVEEQLLLVGVGWAELPALVGVLDRHGERHLAGADAGATDADPALDQGAEHGEEAAVDVVDVGEVAPVLGDLGVPVEHVGARHPHAVEPEPSVVHAVEADLRAVVLDAHAVERVPVLVPDGYDEPVHALGVAVDLELGEHHRHAGVIRGVADVVLARRVVGGGDHELPRSRSRRWRRCRAPARWSRGRSRSSRSSRSGRRRPGPRCRRRGGASNRAGGSRHRRGRTARPTFTRRERSPKAIVSKPATDAPMSPPPPYSVGKPRPVAPVFAIIRTSSRTRSRNSAVGISIASSSTWAYSARFLRVISRMSAYLPSRSAVRAGTSTVGVCSGMGAT